MTMRDLHDQNSDFEEENDENEAGNLQKDVQLIHEEENPEVNDASPEVHDASRIAESGENEKQHVFIANDDYVHESNEGGSENDHERDERTAQSPDANTLTKFSEVQGFQNHESETTCERNEGNETNEGPERRMSESIDSDLKEDINKISQQWQLSKEGEMDKDGNRKRDADGNEDGDGDGDADENSEMSREELNERANAFISAFRRKLVISTAVAEG
ncbi:hypothetical protein KP509_31G064000 [Ceratopteris richardii]|uniref:Uncharacterized protein n=1 Tax=Ceratopteris richardii TaxID=49495 RepID=A0A8T2R0X4_CERRI|nr:hypothetical protein KP509_31G064000 [Ceratopteris richardii]